MITSKNNVATNNTLIQKYIYSKLLAKHENRSIPLKYAPACNVLYF